MFVLNYKINYVLTPRHNLSTLEKKACPDARYRIGIIKQDAPPNHSRRSADARFDLSRSSPENLKEKNYSGVGVIYFITTLWSDLPWST